MQNINDEIWTLKFLWNLNISLSLPTLFVTDAASPNGLEYTPAFSFLSTFIVIPFNLLSWKKKSRCKHFNVFLPCDINFWCVNMMAWNEKKRIWIIFHPQIERERALISCSELYSQRPENLTEKSTSSNYSAKKN